MFLVMELCQGGELADELKKRGYFSESDTKNLMQKLASAISYLHKNGEYQHYDYELDVNNISKIFKISSVQYCLMVWGL